tara:strand:+ start:1512 stop:2837 length:1326 start_codon:yes stop_codon:yes gene_type:complete
MKILFLDIYKKSIARISKDTAGGYGTENNLGDGLVGKSMSYAIKNSIFWPNLSFIQLLQEFKVRNYDAHYQKFIGTYPNVKGYDVIFMCSSIVCFETEILAIRNILKNNNIPIFLCGTFVEFAQEKIPSGVNVLSGNYEFLFEKLNDNNMSLSDLFGQKFLKISNGNSDNLSIINWQSSDLSGNKNLLLGKKKNYLPLIVSRGCPYSCREYCTYPTSQGRKVNRESESETIKRLKIISNQYKSSHIIFRDPVFSINLPKVKSLLKEIGDASLNIEFSAELHLKNIDDEFIELCNYANLTGLKFGIESAFEEVRNSVNRFSIDNDQQKINVEKLKKNKIKTVGMFILVQPSDTVETCEKTIDYSTKLGIDLAQFSIFTPYPGTPFYNKIRSKIYKTNYENFNQYQLVYNHDTITQKKARQLLEKAYTTFIRSKIKKIFFKQY